MKAVVLCVAAALALSTAAFAAPAPEEKVHGSCKQILEACEKAGFVKGEAKKGYGLWLDCIDPIMQGKSTVPGATKALPTVDPKLVSECKEKSPKFARARSAQSKRSKQASFSGHTERGQA